MKPSEMRRRLRSMPGVWCGVVTVLLLFGANVPATDQERCTGNSVTPSPAGSYRILDEDSRIEIPFEIFRGDIRFQCTVNGHKTHMLLDDGFMWDELLFWGSPEVDSLHLEYYGEMEVGGGDDDSEKLISKMASGITVAFPGIEFTDQVAVVTPKSSGNAGMWWGSIGQISGGFLKNFAVDIDFDRMIITLRELDDFEYSGDGVAVPWEPMGFGPHSIPATLHLDDGREISMELLMDLGYNDPLRITVPGQKNVTLPGKKLPASLGFNIQGVETRGFVGRVPVVDIGGYAVKDVLVDFAPRDPEGGGIQEEAMIGLELLSRFNLVYDYKNKQLFVEPNKTFDEPFEYGMSGMVLAPSAGGHPVISQVYEDSPAEEAGLATGDKVLELNGRASSEYDLSELGSIFRQEGASVDLTVEHQGRRREVTIVLRRLI